MDQLQAISSYWLDCIKSEGALEQSFSVNLHHFGLNGRSRAILFDGSRDPFIFSRFDRSFTLNEGRAFELASRSSLKGQEIYFGYPILMFYDHVSRKNRVAPLFVMRLNAERNDKDLTLTKAEHSPNLGSSAFEKLGLKQEEIVALNIEVSEIFESNKASKLETILYLLKKETNLTFIEAIDPDKLSSDETIHPYEGTVIYNKAIIYASEASSFNLHLLNDLEELVKRKDLNGTSLRYITSDFKTNNSEATPVMPFAFDEHQLLAVKAILGSEHTVVTGPPGTGKSQFIANLIINLFLQKKKVLFVSHTGEAVQVVNKRINDHFENLIMQTGRKENRQDLGRRLEEMVYQYNQNQTKLKDNSASHEDINRNWDDIMYQTKYLVTSDTFTKQVEEQLEIIESLSKRDGLVPKIKTAVSRMRLKFIMRKLNKRLVNDEVMLNIRRAKDHHVDLSRSYVKACYLDLILGNELYGQLQAYIDAVQIRRPSQSSYPDKSEKYMEAALNPMNVWSCTLKSLSATFPLKANLFDYVIFDEASQIDLPSAAPALYRARNVVVVGDENQLTHIAKINSKLEEELADKYQLNDLMAYPAITRYTDVSLFNSAKRALHEPEKELKNHYRSNSQIANLFSSVFYGGRLKIYEPDTNLPKDINPGAYWIDVKGMSYKYKSGSKYNPKEASAVIELLKKLIDGAVERHLTIGVTTPYSKQQDIISEMVMKNFNDSQLNHIRVLTVHKFQGSEVDILLFSPVIAARGDASSDYWFIKNKQVLNVAVSRAKHLLLIVGDQEYALASKSKLNEIARYCTYINEEHKDKVVPNRPMNVFELKLLRLLKKIIPKSYDLEPQYVVDNRFSLDFALLKSNKKIAIELDGRQHEIVGGLPVLEDQMRDKYLTQNGWKVIRITVADLINSPESISHKLGAALK